MITGGADQHRVLLGKHYKSVLFCDYLGKKRSSVAVSQIQGNSGEETVKGQRDSLSSNFFWLLVMVFCIKSALN